MNAGTTVAIDACFERDHDEARIQDRIARIDHDVEAGALAVPGFRVLHAVVAGAACGVHGVR